MYGYRIQPNWKRLQVELDELDLWGWVLGGFDHVRPVRLLEPICNPLRVDNHPACYLTRALHRNRIVLNDWANRAYHGIDVYDAIQRAKGFNFPRMLEFITDEFPGVNRLVSSSASREEPMPYAQHLTYREQDWTGEGLAYWARFGITLDQLKEDQVKQVLQYRFNSRANPDRLTQVTPPDVTFALHDESFQDRFKLYRPRMNRRGKWKTNCVKEDIGFFQKADGRSPALIITKSYKDARVLRNEEMEAVWLQGESVNPGDKLAHLARAYRDILVLFDNDQAGREGSELLAARGNRFGLARFRAATVEVNGVSDCAHLRELAGVDGVLRRHVLDIYRRTT